MSEAPALYDRLRRFGTNLETWQAEASRLRAVIDEVVASRHVEDFLLVEVEQSAGLLYDEIAAFKALVAEIAAASPDAAAELATVVDRLHLLLLEVTELGTRLYAARSADALEAGQEALPPVAAS